MSFQAIFGRIRLKMVPTLMLQALYAHPSFPQIPVGNCNDYSLHDFPSNEIRNKNLGRINNGLITDNKL